MTRLVALLILNLLACACGWALHWELSDLSDQPAADCPLGLALDRAGRPGVVFVEAKRQRIYYARRSGGAWDEEEIYQPAGLGGRAGEALNLAIDAHDNRHVALASVRAYQGIGLEYLTDRAGSWDLETPGAPRSYGYDARVALDAAGGVHLACRSSRPDNDLYYLSEKSGRWDVLEAETAGHVGFWIDLAMGREYTSSGVRSATEPSTTSSRRYKPFIAYAEYPRSQEKGAGPPVAVKLRYVDPKGRWTADAIPVAGPAGYGLALELSRWEEPHLSFGGGGRLYHAEKIANPTEGATAAWRVETVVDEAAKVVGIPEDTAHAGDLVGWWTDLALGEEQEPWIVFTAPQGLQLAHRQKGTWTLEPIESGHGKGRWCRIARDGWGGMHVVYYDAARQRVRYAYGRP